MILKNELALQYFPHLKADAARKQLSRYMKENQPLSQELRLAGYNPGRKSIYFTPREAEIIKKHLGAPA